MWRYAYQRFGLTYCPFLNAQDSLLFYWLCLGPRSCLFLPALLFDPEDGGTMLLRNIRQFTTLNTNFHGSHSGRMSKHGSSGNTFVYRS
jgi:hypothetical protein